MAIDVLRSGFTPICFDSSLNFAGGGCSMILEGQYRPDLAATPATADTVLLLNSTRDVDAFLGAGSILAESAKLAFCICPSNVKVYVLPRADAAGATKAVYTLTIGGPATSAGQFTLYMLNDGYSVSVPVLSGDTANAIAAAVAAAIPSNFPYDVAVATNVITLTAKNGGTAGNFLNPIYNWAGFANYAPGGVTVTVANTVVGAGDPVGLTYANVFSECCYNCYGLLSGNVTWQRTVRDYIRSNWDCTKPQCFGHGYVYNNGTLGQVLAAGDNSPEFNRVAYPVNSEVPPYFLVATYAAKSCCSACDNWELSVQGTTSGVLTCLKYPASCKSPWTEDERKSLSAAGFVTWGPVGMGSGTLTSPYIYEDITNYLYDELNRPNQTYRSTIHRRWAQWFATQYATFMNDTFNGLAVFKNGTKIRDGVFGTTVNMVRAKIITWLRSQEGLSISSLEDIDKEVIVKTDFEIKAPCKGIPGEYVVNLLVRPPVRAAKFRTVIAPKLIDNCERTPSQFAR